MPKPNKTDGKVPVTIMLPRTMKNQLNKIAISTKRTRGGYIELALEAQFKKDGVK